MASINITLLLTKEDDALANSAEQVCSILSSKFGLDELTVRSAAAAVERLLGTTSDSNTPQLWVLLGPKVYGIQEVLENEACVPVYAAEHYKSPPTVALGIAKWCSLASNQVRENVQLAVSQNKQKRLVDDAQLHTKSPRYRRAIQDSYDGRMQITGDDIEGDGLPKRMRGKVRDRYEGMSKLALVTTDRQSGFDRMLALVPFKGAVLNLTSSFWFQKTKHIIPNHLLSVPHPNVSIVKKCKPFPIEFVVRYVMSLASECSSEQFHLTFCSVALLLPLHTHKHHSSYMTGSTSTSIWKNYQNGVRNYCGHELPEGMSKNEKLWKNLLTPTTKEEDHDRPISAQDIVSEGWMTQQDLDVCSNAALEIFALGQEIASKRGLILVDTKYEFGRDEETGEILLIDEVHTPDSSRYWLASTYKERVANGQEPDNIDKEFLRLWFRDNCDPYNDEMLPAAPRDLVLELARRYITLYEMITWDDFDFQESGGESAIADAIISQL